MGHGGGVGRVVTRWCGNWRVTVRVVALAGLVAIGEGAHLEFVEEVLVDLLVRHRLAVVGVHHEAVVHSAAWWVGGDRVVVVNPAAVAAAAAAAAANPKGWPDKQRIVTCPG